MPVIISDEGPACALGELRPLRLLDPFPFIEDLLMRSEYVLVHRIAAPGATDPYTSAPGPGYPPYFRRTPSGNLVSPSSDYGMLMFVAGSLDAAKLNVVLPGSSTVESTACAMTRTGKTSIFCPVTSPSHSKTT